MAWACMEERVDIGGHLVLSLGALDTYYGMVIFEAKLMWSWEAVMMVMMFLVLLALDTTFSEL